MGFNTYPNNPFPPSTDRMDVDALEAEVSKLESGLTNVDNATILNTQDLTTPSRTANLYNKNDEYLLAYINTDNGVMYSSENATIVWIKCKPNTTYTVSKQAGTRFMAATTRVKPALGVQTYGYITDFTASSITITTDANAVYLVAYVYASTDQPTTREEMLATVQIEEGSTATAYTPYIPSVESRLESLETKANKITINLRYVDLTDITPGSAGEIDIESVTSGTVTHENLINIIPINSNNTVLDVYTYSNNLYVRAHTRNDYGTPVTTDISMRLYYSVGA